MQDRASISARPVTLSPICAPRSEGDLGVASADRDLQFWKLDVRSSHIWDEVVQSDARPLATPPTTAYFYPDRSCAAPAVDLDGVK